MRKSYIKEQVLYDSLQHRKPRYLAGASLLRPDESSFQQTSKYHRKDSRQHESHTCEQYLCRRIRTLYIPQSITYLYTRKCTSPQQATQHGTEPHNTGFLHPFVVYLYLIHVYFSQSFIHSPASALITASLYFLHSPQAAAWLQVLHHQALYSRHLHSTATRQSSFSLTSSSLL